MTRIVFHIGAHRTGTASFQYAIGKPRYRLRRRLKLVPFTPPKMREFTAAHFRSVFVEKNGKPSAERKTLEAVFAACLEEVAEKECETALFSDENYSGEMDDVLLHGAFYPYIGRYARGICEMLGEDVEFVFSLRDYGKYYASAWSQLYGLSFREDFDYFKPRLLSIKDGWFEAVTRLREGAPHSKIRIIPFESYQGRTNTFFRLMGFETKIELEEYYTNRSMTEEIYQAFKAHYDRGETLSFPDRRAIKDEIGFDGKKMVLWRAEERAVLDGKYARDLLRIQNELEVEFVQG